MILDTKNDQIANLFFEKKTQKIVNWWNLARKNYLAWYDKVDTYFLYRGFKRCISDPNLYVKHVDYNIIVIVLYLDGLIITGSQLLLIQNMKSEL